MVLCIKLDWWLLLFKKYTLLFFLLNIIFFTNLIANDKEKVYLQLQWLDQFQFAGYYVAKEKGFYKEHDLELDFLKHDNNIN